MNVEFLMSESDTDHQLRSSGYREYFIPYLERLCGEVNRIRALSNNSAFRDYCKYYLRSPLRQLEYSFVIRTLMHGSRRESHREMKVLDAGCGVSPLPYLLKGEGYEVQAIDLDQEIIDLLQRYQQDIYNLYVDLGVQDLRNLEFPENSFDFVVSVSVLEHIIPGDELKVITELKRVLRPSGKLIITFDFRPRRLDGPFTEQGRGGGGGASGKMPRLVHAMSSILDLRRMALKLRCLRMKRYINEPFYVPYIYRFMPGRIAAEIVENASHLTDEHLWDFWHRNKIEDFYPSGPPWRPFMPVGVMLEKSGVW